MMYGYYGGYYPFTIFGPILMILFWVIVLFVIVKLLRNNGHWRGWHDGHRPTTRPVDILKERYAKGEITKEQFESMKKDLE